MAGKILVQAEESFFGGDARTTDALKHLITGQTLERYSASRAIANPVPNWQLYKSEGVASRKDNDSTLLHIFSRRTPATFATGRVDQYGLSGDVACCRSSGDAERPAVK